MSFYQFVFWTFRDKLNINFKCVLLKKKLKIRNLSEISANSFIRQFFSFFLCWFVFWILSNVIPQKEKKNLKKINRNFVRHIWWYIFFFFWFFFGKACILDTQCFFTNFKHFISKKSVKILSDISDNIFI